MKKDYINMFETYLYDVIKTYDSKGMAIAIFDKDNTLYEKYIGYSNIEKKTPINEDTIFGIASITKSFTSLGVMKLQEDEIIDVNKNVTEYIDGLKCSENHNPTLSHLLSHNAGYLPQRRLLISEFAKSLDLDYEKDNYSTNDEIAQNGIKEIISQLNSMKTYTGKPGMRMSYSNVSFGVLTEIIRKFGGEKSSCDYIKKNIIDPLGMNRTFFDFNRADRETNISTLYYQNEGEIQSTNDFLHMGYVLMGGGGLKSSVSDMMKYTRMFLNNGKGNANRIVQSDSIEEMLKPRVECKYKEHYGYGLSLGEIDGISYSGHSGGLTGVSSYFAFSNQANKGVIVLCNTSGVPASAIGLAALRLSVDKTPVKDMSASKETTWSRKTIENTIGMYSSEEGTNIEILDLGNSIKLIIAGEPFSVKTISDDLIFIKNKLIESPSRIIRDENNVATAIYSGFRMIQRKSEIL
ncbi:MAG: serine hydrolase domain-containing protein [Bacillota bacterium]|nr:serine hydrolase domain-containing protein [Bacillota bacterium]